MSNPSKWVNLFLDYSKIVSARKQKNVVFVKNAYDAFNRIIFFQSDPR